MSRFLLIRLCLIILFSSGFNIAAALSETITLQDLTKATETLPGIVIDPAKEIVPLDSAKPTAQAVAVVDDRILATGSLDELEAAAGSSLTQ